MLLVDFLISLLDFVMSLLDFLVAHVLSGVAGGRASLSRAERHRMGESVSAGPFRYLHVL